jgi:hypothetical protein
MASIQPEDITFAMLFHRLLGGLEIALDCFEIQAYEVDGDFKYQK